MYPTFGVHTQFFTRDCSKTQSVTTTVDSLGESGITNDLIKSGELQLEDGLVILSQKKPCWYGVSGQSYSDRTTWHSYQTRWPSEFCSCAVLIERYIV